eukprot:4271469-Amphidinium_carterae.2
MSTSMLARRTARNSARNTDCLIPRSGSHALSWVSVSLHCSSQHHIGGAGDHCCDVPISPNCVKT